MSFATHSATSIQQRCRDWLTWALGALKAKASPATIDHLNALIGATITGQGRLFHNGEHILRLAEGDDPISTLAALFHDAVYVQVDWGLATGVQTYLTPFLCWTNGTLCLRPAPELLHHPESACTTLLFGLEHPAPVPAEKFNEFLSALLATQCLKGLLSPRLLAELVVAIEASIPFRATAAFVPSEQLFERLSQANERFGFAMTSDDIELAIHRAVAFANRDVGDFSIADPVIFLDQTWRLLPEFTPALRHPELYSIQDYRSALRSMEGFLNQLDAGQIFQQFRQLPNPLTCQAWWERASHNLAIARLYLTSKVVAVAILEAVASRREQQLPLTDWFGPLDCPERWEERFAAAERQAAAISGVERQVLQIAECGRTRPCHFDLVKSPFAAFLMRSLGFEQLLALRPQAEAFFNQRLSSQQFLASVPYLEQALMR